MVREVMRKTKIYSEVDLEKADREWCNPAVPFRQADWRIGSDDIS